ncbi:peptidylprolyl isomerase A, partial [Staphylococcus aureus]
GYYNGTTFHRVIPRFMIQGGGFTADLKQKQTREPIKNEADNGLRNLKGTIAMARTSDKDSATSQFFINVADNAFLDHGQRDFGYAVFG